MTHKQPKENSNVTNAGTKKDLKVSYPNPVAGYVILRGLSERPKAEAIPKRVNLTVEDRLKLRAAQRIFNKRGFAIAAVCPADGTVLNVRSSNRNIICSACHRRWIIEKE